MNDRLSDYFMRFFIDENEETRILVDEKTQLSEMFDILLILNLPYFIYFTVLKYFSWRRYKSVRFNFLLWLYLQFRFIKSFKTLIVCTIKNCITFRRSAKQLSFWKYISFCQAHFSQRRHPIYFVITDSEFYCTQRNRRMFPMYKILLCHTYRLDINSSLNLWPKLSQIINWMHNSNNKLTKIVIP